MLILVSLKQIGKFIFVLHINLGNLHIFNYIYCVVYSDAGIREAECEKSAMDVKYATDTKIEDNSRMFKLQKAHFDQEINTAVG